VTGSATLAERGTVSPKGTIRAVLSIIVLLALGIVVGRLLFGDGSSQGSRKAVLTALLGALVVLLLLRALFFLFVGWRSRRRVLGPGVIDVAPTDRAQEVHWR